MHQAHSNINKTELVHRRAGIFITDDYNRTSGVSSMLEHLGWEGRRQHGKMVLMYRTVNHLVEIPTSTNLQPVRASRTRGHTTDILCHTAE